MTLPTITNRNHEVTPARLQAPGAVTHEDVDPMSTEHRTDTTTRTIAGTTLDHATFGPLPTVLTLSEDERAAVTASVRLYRCDPAFDLAAAPPHQLQATADGLSRAAHVLQALEMAAPVTDPSVIEQIALELVEWSEAVVEGADGAFDAWENIALKFEVDAGHLVLAAIRRARAETLDAEPSPQVGPDCSQLLDVREFRDSAPATVDDDETAFWADIERFTIEHDTTDLSVAARMTQDALARLVPRR